MTPEQHDRLRIAAEATAARALMLWSARLLHGLLPADSPLRAESLLAFERSLERARADYLLMTFPELHPANSDLHASLMQEAFDNLAAEFLAELSRSASTGSRRG